MVADRVVRVAGVGLLGRALFSVRSAVAVTVTVLVSGCMLEGEPVWVDVAVMRVAELGPAGIVVCSVLSPTDELIIPTIIEDCTINHLTSVMRSYIRSSDWRLVT